MVVVSVCLPSDPLSQCLPSYLGFSYLGRGGLSSRLLQQSAAAAPYLKKIRDTKGIFNAKMGSIKDRNGRDISEAEDIKKRWQEY